MGKDIVKETQARIQELKDKKAAELEHINNELKVIAQEYEAATQGMKTAMEATDLDAYEEAEKKRHTAKIKKEMYSARYDQLQKKEYISEAESDKVIDSLLAYEDELTAGFKAAVAEPLKKLDELQKAYIDAVEDAEQTIRAWTGNIHANYRNNGTTYTDGTNRSSQPVPVRRIPYTGCSEAHQLKSYLDKVKELY